MGKTTLLLELHKRLGDKLKILGDDTCIAYRDKLYSYPQDVRVRGKGSKFFHLEKFVFERNCSQINCGRISNHTCFF